MGVWFFFKQNWLVNFVTSLLFIYTSCYDVILSCCNHGYRLAWVLGMRWQASTLSSNDAFCADLMICAINTDSGLSYWSINPFTSERKENSQCRLQSTWSSLSQRLICDADRYPSIDTSQEQSIAKSYLLLCHFKMPKSKSFQMTWLATNGL